MVARARIRLVCGECRWKTTGSRGDSARKGCEQCGGQLREVTMNGGRKKRKPYGR